MFYKYIKIFNHAGIIYAIILVMNENLKQTLKLLPSLPGCYIYYNKDGEVIYVGKAKILKRRVMSYFNRKHDSVKVNVLVSQIERL